MGSHLVFLAGGWVVVKYSIAERQSFSRRRMVRQPRLCLSGFAFAMRAGAVKNRPTPNYLCKSTLIASVAPLLSNEKKKAAESFSTEVLLVISISVQDIMGGMLPTASHLLPGIVILMET